MLDRLAAELFSETAPHEVLHSELAHRLETEDGRTVLRLEIPFSDKGDINLRKVGAELIVRVGREKRTIILPAALSDHRPAGASFEGGTLKVSFEDGRSTPQPGPALGADEPAAANKPAAAGGAAAPGERSGRSRRAAQRA
jgi:HSP20 family molecular chaperone IbpA